jgi:hypothetical protein
MLRRIFAKEEEEDGGWRNVYNTSPSSESNNCTVN